MKIPKSFRLKGKKWTVEYKWNLTDREDDGFKIKCDGLCVYQTRTIFIEHSMPRVDKWPVFLHELVHAILFEAHISGLDGPAGNMLEEVIADAVADGMNDLFSIRWKRQR